MKLTLTKRAGLAKSELKRIRREGDIPAVFYGVGHAVEKVVVKGAEFQAVLRHLKQGQLATHLFELEVDGHTRQATIKDVQYHPVTYAIEHLDFASITEDRPLSVNVPIQIVGLADCPGVKLGGTLRQVIRTLKVSCLARDIPQEFQIDVRDLNIAQSKYLSDIRMPPNVRPLASMNEVAVVIAKGKAAS